MCLLLKYIPSPNVQVLLKITVDSSVSTHFKKGINIHSYLMYKGIDRPNNTMDIAS